jgi:6-phosphofructokinase
VTVEDEGIMKKIVINTDGGDAPGLNAVIRAIVLSAMNRGWEVYSSRETRILTASICAGYK